MQIAEYYTIRRAVRDNAPAPDAAATEAMEIELRAALLATGMFHSVEVGRTDDPDRLVIAMVGFAPGMDASEAAVALARVWTKHVAYGFWRAQTIRVDKGHIELQGATRLSLQGHYCTVHLIAEERPEPAVLPSTHAATQAVIVHRPVAGRPTPSTGLGQTASAALPVPPVRRSRRWITGRSATVA
jgi:hypothetical protein